MQIAINISHNLYESIMKGYALSKLGEHELYKAVQNGIPLPEHYGRLGDLDALYEEMENGIKAGNYENGYEDYAHINNMDDCLEAVKYAETIIPATEEESIKQTKKEVNCINCSFKWNCYKHGKLVNPCDAYIEQHEQTATEETSKVRKSCNNCKWVEKADWGYICNCHKRECQNYNLWEPATKEGE